MHIDLASYLWLPATSGTIKLGRGATTAISAGMPSVSSLVTSLTGAFIGAGVMRYGPWLGELNIDYVGVSETKGLPPDLLGNSRSLKISPWLVRVAPGIGYQVFNRPIEGVPTTLDARVGFAYFASGATLDLDRTGLLGRQRVASVSDSGDFVQPWAGLRAAIYPWARWRFALDAQVQGWGVDGGVWGWGTSATATWAATKWLNLVGGYSALSTGRNFGSRHAISSIRLTEYGPLMALEFTF